MFKVGAIMMALAAGLGASELGQPAPGFSLPNQDGRQVKLEDFKGKAVVLEWLNEGCPFVKKHYNGGNMQSLQKKYSKQGVVWLSVVSSAPGEQGYFENGKAAKGFIKAKKAGMKHILLDPEGTVGQSYGAKATPHMYVVDKDGNLAYRGAIDSIRSTKSEDTKEAKNYVAQALDEILAGKPVSEPETKAYGCSVKYKK